MKILYFAVAIVQALTISASAVLRRRAWWELDFPGTHHGQAEILNLSGVLFLLWLATILAAAILAARDKPHRSSAVLFLVVLFPFVEFVGWFAFSF
jgi:hypothetical protein